MMFITRTLVVLSFLATLVAMAAPPILHSTDAAQANVLAKRPISFEENAGQTDSRARYLLRGPGYTAFFNEREVIFSFRHSERQITRKRAHRRTVGTSVVQLSFAGANPRASLAGLEELPGRSHYLIGTEAADWRTDVATFARLLATDVYPGIDLTYYGTAHDLEYDFVVRPGADASAIRLRSEGGTQLTLGSAGELGLILDGEEVANWRAPIAYQQIDGVRHDIACAFVLRGPREAGFSVGEYDASKPLVIDPVLLYSTLLGGSGAEAAEAITISSNSIYIVGETTSLNFPAPGGYRTTAYASNDVFVARFNSNGTALVFATYLGGTGDDFGNSIDVDANGNVSITGGTDSSNFPLKNQFQSSRSGISDAFVTKLSAAGNALLYSTYLGGNGYESGNAVKVGNGGNIYVVGETDSEQQFPKKTPFQNNAGGLLDGFVARFNPTLSGAASLIFSSWIGGSDDDRATGIEVDGTYFYVAGEVDALDFFSSDFPVKNALQPEYGGGGSDAWLARLPLSGATVSWATYVGGQYEDAASSVVVDTSGNLYLVGTTTSDNFPTVNAQQPVIGGGGSFYTSDAFATKISGNGSNILFSTYFGGEVEETGSGIGVDANGLIYITGQTSSSDLPVSGGALQSTYNGGPGDAFIAKLNPAVPGRNGIVYSTYFGGVGTEDPGTGNCIFVTSNGDYYFVGTTTSTNGFPSESAFSGVYGGGYSDAFVAKLASQPDLCVSVSASIEPVLVGSNFTYTFRVNNNSRSNFSGVTLTNVLPPSVNYFSAAASRGTVMRDGQTIVWSIGNITNHGGATLNLSVQTTLPGFITNQARLTAMEPELNISNNVDLTVSTVRGIADLVITKTATPNPEFASSNLTYSIMVTNRGPWNASDVYITSELPRTADFVSAIATRGFLHADDGFLTCFIPVLTNGAVVTITVIVAPQAGIVTNIADVTAFELDLFPNNSATNITTVNPVSELGLRLAASSQQIFASSNVTYTVTVSNRGPSSATGVVITNVLPPNVAFVSATMSRGSANFTNGMVIGTLSPLTNRQVVTLTIVARGTLLGSETNSVRVMNESYDPILENNSASLPLTVLPLANLALSGSGPLDVPFASQHFTVTLNVLNAGPTLSTDVVLTVTIPPSVSVASPIVSQGTASVESPGIVCALGTLESNALATLTFDAVASASIATINAVVSSTVADPFISNNSASITVQTKPLPRLFWERPGSNISTISWSVAASNFVPEFSTNTFDMLNAPIDWSLVTNEIFSTNGFNLFTNVLPNGIQTFRLRLQ
jgi:uncharacterized repeat protein (TIGR01451 family)